MYAVTTKIRQKINMNKLLICSICDSYPFLKLNLFLLSNKTQHLLISVLLYSIFFKYLIKKY